MKEVVVKIEEVKGVDEVEYLERGWSKKRKAMLVGYKLRFGGDKEAASAIFKMFIDIMRGYKHLIDKLIVNEDKNEVIFYVDVKEDWKLKVLVDKMVEAVEELSGKIDKFNRF